MWNVTWKLSTTLAVLVAPYFLVMAISSKVPPWAKPSLLEYNSGAYQGAVSSLMQFSNSLVTICISTCAAIGIIVTRENDPNGQSGRIQYEDSWFILTKVTLSLLGFSSAMASIYYGARLTYLLSYYFGANDKDPLKVLSVPLQIFDLQAFFALASASCLAALIYRAMLK